MKCPTCPDTKLSLSERSGIEIDYCPDCRGIWLDRGELDKLIAKANEQAASELRAAQPPQAVTQQPPTVAPQQPFVTQPQYQQQPYQQHGQHGYYQKPYKRKKSFLEEIFD